MKMTFKNANSSFTVSTIGGMLTDFSVDGTDVIYSEHKVDEKSRGGVFVCFPVFGNPPDELTEFSGMGKHGFLRNQELVVVRRSSEGTTLFGTNECQDVFPWKLEYYVSAYFHGSRSIALGFSVKRLEDGLGGWMPFNMAFHPYFSSLGRSVARIGDDMFMEFGSQSTRVPIHNNIIIEQGSAMKNAFILGGFNKDSYYTLWSDDQEKYFCVEPVYGYPEMLNTTEGPFLREGEQKAMSCVIIRINP